MTTKIFPLSSSIILKQTDDPAWPRFATWANTQFNVHLPKIYDLQTVGNKTFAVMEHLTKFEVHAHSFTSEDLPVLYWILLNSRKNRMARFISRYVSNISDFGTPLQLESYFAKHHDELFEQANSHPFVETYNAIYEEFHLCKNDFKPANVMVRAHTNEFVHIDPITCMKCKCGKFA